MIHRLVKMTFQPDKVDDFLKMFESKKEKIRSFKGCHYLALWQDKNNANLFFTVSIWENESCLDKYRLSDFFKSIWKITKTYFDDKPVAWTNKQLHQLP